MIERAIKAEDAFDVVRDMIAEFVHYGYDLEGLESNVFKSRIKEKICFRSFFMSNGKEINLLECSLNDVEEINKSVRMFGVWSFESHQERNERYREKIKNEKREGGGEPNV